MVQYKKIYGLFIGFAQTSVTTIIEAKLFNKDRLFNLQINDLQYGFTLFEI